MARVKKLTKEELLERKRARERERYRRIKSDPVQSRIQQEKEKIKYENKKKKKLVKLVADMNPREHRQAKRVWRERKQNTKKRKNAQTETNIVTPPDSGDEENQETNEESVQIKSAKKRIRRDRSKIIQRNKKLLKENAILKRQRDMYRKRAERAGEKNGHEDTPRITVKKLMTSQNKKVIGRKLLFGEALQAQLKHNFEHIQERQKKFMYVSSILGDRTILKKCNAIKDISSLLPSHSTRYTRVNNRLKRNKQRALSYKVKHKVRCFLEEDENSRLAPGKPHLHHIFTVFHKDVIQILPAPTILLKKRVITYVFPESINVNEK